jgi:hypothetical protein
MTTDPEAENEIANSIAPDVLGVLEITRFFERLDERFYSLKDAKVLEQCTGTHEVSVQILQNMQMDADEIRDVLEVLKSRGGCCDCEVLYNVANESNFRSDYWKARARGENPRTPHSSAQSM